MNAAQRLPSAPEVGELVKGKYRLLRLLGDGGMGSVHEARHEGLGIKVALKFLHPRLCRYPELVRRFLDEARLAAPIRSPEVVQVLDVDQREDGLAFIVMELLSGQTLRELLDRRRLGEAEARAFAVQLADGLEAVHGAGIIHRDLKPENVMVTRGPSGEPRLKLLDFGVAMPGGAADRGSLSGMSSGTPGYMAPEQASGGAPVDARADIYSLGVVLFEMLTGQMPAEGGPDLGAIAPDFAAVIARATAIAPADRFGSAGELRAALTLPASQVLIGGLDLSPTPPSSRASRTSIEVPWFIADPAQIPPVSAPRPRVISDPMPIPAPPTPAPIEVNAQPPLPRNRRIGAAVALALLLGVALGGGATVLFPRGGGGGRSPDSVVAAMMAAPSTAMEADPAPRAPEPEVAPADALPVAAPTAAAQAAQQGSPAKPHPAGSAAQRSPAAALPPTSALPREAPPALPQPAPTALGKSAALPRRRHADPPARLPADPPPEVDQRQDAEPDPWPGSRRRRAIERQEPREQAPRGMIILIPVR